jgi:hypothetical protein
LYADYLSDYALDDVKSAMPEKNAPLKTKYTIEGTCIIPKIKITPAGTPASFIPPLSTLNKIPINGIITNVSINILSHRFQKLFLIQLSIFERIKKAKKGKTHKNQRLSSRLILEF